MRSASGEPMVAGYTKYGEIVLFVVRMATGGQRTYTRVARYFPVAAGPIATA